MSAELNPTSLKVELALRGWTNADLAQRARINRGTVTAALKGNPIAAKSVYAIALALQLNPPLEIPAGLVKRAS